MLLSDERIKQELEHLNGWEHIGDTIQKAFSFSDFNEGLDFVNKVAKISEEINHHPDVLLTYGSVLLTITTHSENGITKKDIDFAKRVNEL